MPLLCSLGAKGLEKNVFSQWRLLRLLSCGKIYLDYEELSLAMVLLIIPLYKSTSSPGRWISEDQEGKGCFPTKAETKVQ